jgi:hypothetical protein
MADFWYVVPGLAILWTYKMTKREIKFRGHGYSKRPVRASYILSTFLGLFATLVVFYLTQFSRFGFTPLVKLSFKANVFLSILYIAAYAAVIIAAFKLFGNYFRNKERSRMRSFSHRESWSTTAFRFLGQAIVHLGIFFVICVLLFGPFSAARAKQSYANEVKAEVAAKPCVAGKYGPYRWGGYQRTYTVDDLCKVTGYVSESTINRIEFEFIDKTVPEQRPGGQAQYLIQGKIYRGQEYKEAQKHFEESFKLEQDQEVQQRASWSNSVSYYCGFVKQQLTSSTKQFSAAIKTKFGGA